MLGNFLSLAFDLPKPVNLYLTSFLIVFRGNVIGAFGSGPITFSIYDSYFQFNYEIAKMKHFLSLSKNEQKLRLEIAREMYECGGIIKYLRFDNDEYIKNLTKTFKWNISGIETFKKLILYRHFHKKAAYNFPHKE